MSNDEHLRYPVGKFSPKDSYTADELQELILRIEMLPAKFEAVARQLTKKQLDTPYRDGGWTARQVIHHVADSHSNAYIRIKWTITEETPTIKAYDEKRWAETPDASLDPAISLNLLKALHVKFVALLRLLDSNALNREFRHPETNKLVRLDRLIATYAWHGEHHLGHLKIVAEK